jgi:hypothetical protein
MGGTEGDSMSEQKRLRSTGRGYYTDRGLKYPYDSTHYRDRRRADEERSIVILGRELDRLSRAFPDFRKALNQLRFKVLLQNRSQEWKSKTLLSVITQLPVSRCELLEETQLDSKSIEAILLLLQKEGRVVRCDRQGNSSSLGEYWRRR